MGPTGPAPGDVKTVGFSTSGEATPAGISHSISLSTTAPDLARVVDAWPTLSEERRAAILRLLE
jgi:hypothetical protein